MDSAYLSKYIGVAQMLWGASQGVPSSIPVHYAEHLSHTYSDGSISLASLLNRFENAEDLEDYEFEEAIEILGKVNPRDWPNVEDIAGVDVVELLSVYDQDTEEYDYVEDNLGTAEKVEKGLAKVIESVFGAPVTKIRNKSGQYPTPDNNFMQESDGTFAGTFTHGDHEFIFEIAPTEGSWLCTYRMTEGTLDNLPPIANEDKEEEDKEKKDYSRNTRNRGWR